MSPNAIHLRSYSPDLLVEFNLPPGTHARIGASPEAEITLPLSEFGAYPCTIGRFQDGRHFLAYSDGTIAMRLDLPCTITLPPYDFHVFQPEDPAAPAPAPTDVPSGRKHRETIAERIHHLFRKGGGAPTGQK